MTHNAEHGSDASVAFFSVVDGECELDHALNVAAIFRYDQIGPVAVVWLKIQRLVDSFLHNTCGGAKLDRANIIHISQ